MVHRSTLVALVVALSATAVVGCAQAPAGLTDVDRAAIRAAEQDSVKAVNNKNWEGWTSRFASDGIMMGPNGPMVQGHDQILAWANAFPPTADFSIEMPEIEGTASMAYSRGSYKLKILPPGMSEIQDSGKFLEIWAKQADGTWKVKRDIFNSDIPMPPPPPPMAPPSPPAKKK